MIRDTTDLRINKHGLDDELEIQPGMIEEVSTQLAAANSRRDTLKENHKVVSAQRNLFIRQQLLQANEKVTDKTVDAMVDADMERIQAYKAYLMACAEAEKLQGRKEAWQAKGYALADLCKLFIGSYFTQTSIKSPDTRAVEDAAYQQNKAAINQHRVAMAQQPQRRQRI